MNSIKRKHGLTNSEIAELVNNLSDDDFHEVFLELAEINNVDIDGSDFNLEFENKKYRRRNKSYVLNPMVDY